MCIIIAKPKNQELPKEEHIINGESNNRDGMGLCFRKDGSNEVVIKKGFEKIKELVSFVKTNIKKEDTLVIHFRKATSGLTDGGNCHPFPITKNGDDLRKLNITSKVAMAHNGVISGYGYNETYSDTQRFIMDIMSEKSVIENLGNSGIQKLILNRIGVDRLAILYGTGKIRIFGDWYIEDGIMFSNTSYKTKRVEYNTYKNDTPKRNYNTLTPYRGSTGVVKGNFAPSYKKKDFGLERCDGCGILRDNVKEIKFKKQKYSLCKGCRRDLSNKTLVLKNKNDTELIQCDSCRHWHTAGEMDNTKYINTDLILCTNCSGILASGR